MSAAGLDMPEKSPASVLRSGWEFMRKKAGYRQAGLLPVLMGLVLIGSVFGLLNERFLSPENLANLALQIPPTGMVALGIVFVLLIGEVDLSAGSVCGLCAVAMTTAAVRHGANPLFAVMLAVICGIGVGTIHGVLFTKVGIPSFVVTLAGLIGWQGVQLMVLGREGTINLPFDGAIANLSDLWLKGISLWLVGISIVGLYVLACHMSRQRRLKSGLPVQSLSRVGLRVLALAALVGIAVVTLSLDRGAPLTFLLFVAVVVGMDLGLRHTILGRRIYAVGGNAEAARRAGINVTAIRIGAFAMCSALAALGGVLSASRLAAVNQSSGGGDLLLNAIASAVIGGVSLFGGRGRPYAALLGVLVIQSITNGMLLLNVDSSVRYMVTALVLVAAVAMDSLSRR